MSDDVDRLLRSTLCYAQQSRAIEVRLTRWFGQKWLGFSHKSHGCFGVHSIDDLRVPPFVDEGMRAFSVSVEGDTLLRSERTASIHVLQKSDDNKTRLMRDLFARETLFWFGAEGERLSMLAYVWNKERHVPLYVGLKGGLVKTRVNLPSGFVDLLGVIRPND